MNHPLPCGSLRAASGAALCAAFLLAGSPAGSADPSVRMLDFVADEFGSGGILELEVSDVSIGEILSIERSGDLGESEAWGAIEASPQIVETVPTTMSVHLDDERLSDFFRVVSSPSPVSTREGGVGIEDGARFDDLLAALRRLLPDQQISLQPTYLPEDIQDPPGFELPDPPAGSFEFLNIDELSEKMGLPERGLRLIATPPSKDDPQLADRLYPPSRDDQGSVDKPVDLPGDGGEGEIDDGWQGDNIVVLPVRGEVPEPGEFDMVFEKPDLPGDNDGDLVLDPKLPPTRNVRVVLDFKPTGQNPRQPGMPIPAEINPRYAQLDEGLEVGDGLIPPLTPIPTIGQYLLYITGPNDQILRFQLLGDPLACRVYNNEEDTGPGRGFPNRGSHDFGIEEQASLGFVVPLPQQDPNDDLAGIEVHLCKLTSAFQGPENALTPEVFRKYRDNLFEPVAVLSGRELAALLEKGPPVAAEAIGTTAPATVTTLHRSGSNGSKYNIAIIGEGFTAANQDTFNDYVDDVILDMFRNRDIHPEVLNAINLFRINTFAQDNGVTQVNSSGNVTTSRRTALDYRYSGIWSRCWMEGGPTTGQLFANLTSSLCPQADLTITVLNETGFGGCAGGSNFTITLGVDWTVVAHEFGHRPGGQGDEYQCSQGSGGCGCYTGSEPGAPNLTSNTNRATLEWNEWVPAWRPIPTSQSQIADTTQDVGLFAGATIGSGQWWNCIYRPSWRGRMNNNSPVHNPRGYTWIRDVFRTYQQANLRRFVTGDFNGDGFADIVQRDGRQISLHLADDRDTGPNDPMTGSPPRAVTGVLEPTWYFTDRLRNAALTRSWQIRTGDQHVVGDFDGDGRDDLYVINQSDWNQEYVGMLRSFGDRFEPVARYDDNLPGWQMRPGDQFFSCDFNGDGRDDLLVYNGTNWNIPYFGMLRSTGSGLVMQRRFDQYLPGWEMGRREQFILGDYNGDGRCDLVAFEPDSWAQVHFRVYTSTGTTLSLQTRHYGTVDVPGPNWQMRRRDKVYALDFNEDGNSDIAFFNGLDWGPVYLGLYAVDDGELNGVQRYNNVDNPLPGWQMQRRDRHWTADVDGDGDDDLVVYNKDNWSTQYLGMLRSNGSNALAGSWQDDWIGSWNLGSTDDFKVADFRGGAGWDDLFVFNGGWFGMLRSYQNRYVQETLYRKWIHNHRYHRWGWW